MISNSNSTEFLQTYKFSKKLHPYHIVDPSIWPFCTAWSLFCVTFGGISVFHNLGFNFVFWFGVISLIFCIVIWVFQVFKESDRGFHTLAVQHSLKLGFILFIASEVMFFFSFFWAFFHSSLSPAVTIGSVWPPLGIHCFSPWSIPLLNTLILLTSGLTVTRTHMLIMLGNYRLSNCLLDTTVLLGILFLGLQFMEYNVAPFSISDGIYGSVFFLLTGFHGFHVFVGVIFLLFAKFRLITGKLHTDDHISFEVASWYWHFVDIVWIIVYATVYFWAGRH